MNSIEVEMLLISFLAICLIAYIKGMRGNQFLLKSLGKRGIIIIGILLIFQTFCLIK